MMQYQPFTLLSREEVSQFEDFLDQTLAVRSAFSLKHISLTGVFDQLQKVKDGGRIFAALLDVQINFSMLWLDSSAVGAAWAAFAPAGTLSGGSVLDSFPKFLGKMDIHRYNSSFVLRYRAVWDKIMGLLILIGAASEYDRFYSASSRKRAFRKIATKFWDPASIANLIDYLGRFARFLRTAEAHGTGVLRKYTFSMETMNKNPQIELLNYWNVVNGFVSELGKYLASNNGATINSMGLLPLSFDVARWSIGAPWDSQSQPSIK
jgi:hypothetical protein